MDAVQERFESLLPLSRILASKYATAYHGKYGEILTSAMLGAWKAAQTWDESFDCSLKTWGERKISGYIIDEYRREVATWGGSRREHRRVYLESIDEPDVCGVLLANTLADKRPEREFARIEDHDMFIHLRLKMDAKEWDILKSRICEEESLKSIGKRWGVSESRICQIMPRILKNARMIIEDMEEARWTNLNAS